VAVASLSAPTEVQGRLWDAICSVAGATENCKPVARVCPLSGTHPPSTLMRPWPLSCRVALSLMGTRRGKSPQFETRGLRTQSTVVLWALGPLVATEKDILPWTLPACLPSSLIGRMNTTAKRLSLRVTRTKRYTIYLP